MIKVIFTYDEQRKLWDPVVYGAANEQEAKEAFNSISVTSRNVITTGLMHLTALTEDGGIRIFPAKHVSQVKPGEHIINEGDQN